MFRKNINTCFGALQNVFLEHKGSIAWVPRVMQRSRHRFQGFEGQRKTVILALRRILDGGVREGSGIEGCVVFVFLLWFFA